jgi:hypothetical protein
MNTTTNTSPRAHHLRPALAVGQGRRQHMAHPVTVDGRSYLWVSLCGVEIDPARTARALRRHGGHTGQSDCLACSKIIRTFRMYPSPLEDLAEAIRR